MKRILMILILLLALSQVAVAKDYVIGAGDSLDISVWGVDALSVGVVVRPDGKITIPAAGDIAAEPGSRFRTSAILPVTLLPGRCPPVPVFAPCPPLMWKA